MRFEFCPRCGTRLGRVPSGAGRGITCPSCGRTFYDNPAPTVSAAIVEGDRTLVTVRARPPEKGKVDVPGGFLTTAEGAVEGLRREVREELGVDIDVTDADFLQAAPHPYGEDGDWNLALGFRARLSGGAPHAADDVAGFAWVTLEELEALDFAWEHDRELVRKALEHGRH